MKRADVKIQEKLQFSFYNTEKQVECRKTTTEEVSIDWSHLVKKSMIADSSPVSNTLTSLLRLWKLKFKKNNLACIPVLMIRANRNKLIHVSSWKKKTILEYKTSEKFTQNQFFR